MKANKQEFIDHIKAIYPNMIEDFWYPNGELHFYISEMHEETGECWACIKRNGRFEILKEF